MVIGLLSSLLPDPVLVFRGSTKDSFFMCLCRTLHVRTDRTCLKPVIKNVGLEYERIFARKKRPSLMLCEENVYFLHPIF